MITDYKDLANILGSMSQTPGDLFYQAANAIDQLGEAFLREREGKEAALEGLYRVYVNIGEDTDGARNAKELFGPWVGFDPAVHVPSLVADIRKMMEEDYETDLERAFDRGRTAVIEYALRHVENEPEHLAGYIDQHVVGVGGSQITNPYGKVTS